MKTVLSIILGLIISTSCLAKSITINVPDEFLMHTHQRWSQIEKIISSGEYQEVILNWSGRGGYVQAGIDFIKSINQGNQKGTKVIINIVGVSESMHSIAAC